MKIAIAGYGVEGQVSFRHYAQNTENDITIVDQAYPQADIPSGVKTIIGEDAFNNLLGFDIVIRTPALSSEKINTDGKIWSATNEFFSLCPAPIIGITGTKGKGTVASLVASILEKSGRKVWLVGNIGIAALEVLSDISHEDIVVYELSSFQLWDIEFSPRTAVMLFVEPEHLNIHKNSQDYFAAKLNITKYQTKKDELIYYKDNKLIDISHTKAQKIPYPDNQFAHVIENKFYYGEIELGSTDNLKLLGAHNLDNACAAINAVWSYVNTPQIIMDGIAGFSGLPHRLQMVGEANGIYYFDDSIATTPSATIAAINAIDRPKHLILGGSSKGLDYKKLAKRMTDADVVSAVLIGQEADIIAKELDDVGFKEYIIMSSENTMKDIVKATQKRTKTGDAVLLSPGATSFGLYKDYIDRGNQFIQVIRGL